MSVFIFIFGILDELHSGFVLIGVVFFLPYGLLAFW